MSLSLLAYKSHIAGGSALSRPRLNKVYPTHESSFAQIYSAKFNLSKLNLSKGIYNKILLWLCLTHHF